MNTRVYRDGKSLSRGGSSYVGLREMGPVKCGKGTQFSKLGRHELLVILSAHPMNGGKPTLLDVESHALDVTK